MEESTDIRVLLDGLEVESISELRKVVDAGRLFLGSGNRHDCAACLAFWADERAILMTDLDVMKSEIAALRASVTSDNEKLSADEMAEMLRLLLQNPSEYADAYGSGNDYTLRVNSLCDVDARQARLLTRLINHEDAYPLA